MGKILLSILGLSLLFASFGITVFENAGSGDIKKPPIFQKGTFWKGQREVIQVYGTENKPCTLNFSCYVDGASKYHGIDVYHATVIHLEEGKLYRVFFDKVNLKIVGAAGFWPNYFKDTMVTDFKLLDFPLFEGKKWESKSKFQPRPRGPVNSYDSKYEVAFVRDTTIRVREREIKTRAFYLKAEFVSDSNTFKYGYTYLAPRKDFPGSCPVFLWSQLTRYIASNNINVTIDLPVTITDFNW